MVARICAGSIGQALNLDLDKFRERRETMFKVVESLIVSQNRAVLLRTTEEINDAKNKDFYSEYLDILQTLIHDVWTLCLNANPAETVNSDLAPQLKRLAIKAEKHKLASWLTAIETLRENFAVNLNKKIATDALFMQMAGV